MADSKQLGNNTSSKDFLKQMSDKEKQRWAKAIVNRMMLAWQVKNHSGLAAKLGMHHKTPSNWIQKRTVPWTAIYSCHKATGKSLDWLYDGHLASFEITSFLRKKLAKAGQQLLDDSEKMEMIKILSPAASGLLTTGMINTLLELTQLPSAQTPTISQASALDALPDSNKE